MRTSFFFTVLFCGVCNLLFAQEAKYELQSAIIQKEAKAVGQQINIEWYVDDYGRKESIFTTVQLPMGLGSKALMVIMEGNKITTIDLDDKKANTTTLSESVINFLKLTPEVIREYDIREVGEETVAGKPCKIYTVRKEEMGMTADVKMWVWKGLQLKMETTMGGTTLYSETTTRIQENVPIPADKLQVPPGLEFE
ncbi:MAG: hypothetical protein LUH10_08745 [Tannerellaceae bacterium]|nr:hypothetical protein [Tannerellaceae bacterium]